MVRVYDHEWAPGRISPYKHVSYRVPTGNPNKPYKRVRRSSGCTTERAARKQAEKWQEEAELRHAGLLPKSEVRRPFRECLDEWDGECEAAGNSLAHCRRTKRRVERFFEGCEWVMVSQINSGDALRWLAKRMRGKRFGAVSANNYITALKIFANWCSRPSRGYLAPGTLDDLRRFREEGNYEHPRRVLTDDEFDRLVAAAKAGRQWRGLSGLDRAMLYCVAANTGFRAGELASLKPESFEMDARPPIVHCRAGYSKRRREDVIPIPKSVLADLAAWMRSRPAGQPLWPGKWHEYDAAEMIRIDQDPAGIAYQTAAGFADFHALRSRYIAQLDDAGVSLLRIQQLARHSSPTLTARYVRNRELDDLAEAADRLGCTERTAERRPKRDVKKPDGTRGDKAKLPDKKNPQQKPGKTRKRRKK